ncbi:MAG: N-formylglutamate amidohydrolase [Kiloniellales bacterium]|nr:N-formylglutamate amidohydrolase [Kiloniellales bacterium]
MSDVVLPLKSPGGALLAPDEPATVEIVNPEASAPVLLVCDHASNFIPRALANLGLDETHLWWHIAYDIGVAEVTRLLSRRLGATAILCGFSRLVIDPNRGPDMPSSIPETVDGVAIPGNRNLSEAERQERIATFFKPYHQAIEGRLRMLTARGPAPAVISLHSFTPVMDGFERPWQVAALWDRDPRLPLPFMAALRSLGYTVGDNEPYSGRDFHGYTMQRHADAQGFANLLIEIRQDLIDTADGVGEWADILAGALRDILADPRIHETQAPA